MIDLLEISLLLQHFSSRPPATCHKISLPPSSSHPASWISSAPNLLILLIPPSGKSDDDFNRMCHDYANTSSIVKSQRTGCFRLEESTSGVPHWLLVQQLAEDFHAGDGEEIRLKKVEIDYFWRDNGWEDVDVEFFRAREQTT